MNISKFKDPESGRMQFRVYSNDYLPFEDINCFLRHLEYRDLSPNTVKAYAHDLVFFFKYLTKHNLDWSNINLDQLVQFVNVLRHSSTGNLKSTSILRSEKTINRHISSVFSFYRYQFFNNGLLIDLGARGIISEANSFNQHNGFLSFAKSARPQSVVKRRSLIKQNKTLDGPLKIVPSKIQFKLLEACTNNRDRLLLSLLLETGMRIGQALQLKHEDIETWNQCLYIRRRMDNPNEVYAKTRKEYSISLSTDWLELYTTYLINDQGELDADYVFTSLYRKDGGDLTSPLSYQRSKTIFKNLGKKVGYNLNAHMFRHTHATELLKTNTAIEIVAKRLGHSSIETTRSMYEHLTAQDMRKILDEAKGINDIEE